MVVWIYVLSWVLSLVRKPLYLRQPEPESLDSCDNAVQVGLVDEFAYEYRPGKW